MLYARSWWEQHGRSIAKAVESPDRSVMLPDGRPLRFPPAAEEASAWARLAKAQSMLLRSSPWYSPGSTSLLSAFLTGALVSVLFLLVNGGGDVNITALAIVVVFAMLAGVAANLLVKREA